MLEWPTHRWLFSRKRRLEGLFSAIRILYSHTGHSMAACVGGRGSSCSSISSDDALMGDIELTIVSVLRKVNGYLPAYASTSTND